jgi:hypothetical protein
MTSLPAPKPQPEVLRPNERDVLKWALENSQDASVVRPDHLMSHEEFKEMWNELCPDVIKQLKDNIAIVRGNPTKDQLYVALDRLLFLVEDIDAADWFVDLNGYDDAFRLIDDPDSEVRMAAAWIIANTLQNNPKDQQKFLDKYGLAPVFASFDREDSEKPATRKFTLVSKAILAFKPLRQQFYALNGIQKCQEFCAKFRPLYFRFCWLIGAVLDETDPDDLAVFKQLQLKEFLLAHAGEIEDQEILQSVVSRLD